MLRVLVLSGSERAGSYNKRLAAVAADCIRMAGAEADLLDLRALDLPIYDGDIELAGMPAGAFALRDAFADSDALICVSPEYNGYPTPLLINAFDWVSRVKELDGRASGLTVIGGKVAAVMSASPGKGGGLRSLIAMRQFLQLSLGLLVAPEQFALASAGNAFDEHGALTDDAQLQSVRRVVASVLRTAAALKQPVEIETAPEAGVSAPRPVLPVSDRRAGPAPSAAR